LKDKPIGVFDSGLGGLTVLKEIHRALPRENLIYFGDTARVPYGNKSSATIIRYSQEITDFLLARDVKAIVVACNTASSFALDTLRSMTEVPVLGVIEPAVRSLIKKSESSAKAALIATKSTIASGAYDLTLKRLGGSQKLIVKACPLLVPLIEEGFSESAAAELVLREYLTPIAAENPEYLILGCTHYPLIAQAIQRLFPALNLIDSAEETARELHEFLEQKQLAKKSGSGRVELYVSDMTESMRALKNLFFNGKVDRFEVAQVAIDG